MIVIVMTFDVDPTHRDRVADAMAGMAALTRQEEGCIVYRYTADLEQANRFHLTEVWESEPAVEAHLRTRHAAEFVPLLEAHARFAFIRGYQGAMAKYRVPPPVVA